MFFADVSADGTRTFFSTTQKLTADDQDSGRVDTYERAGGVTTLVTKPTGVPDPDSGVLAARAASADGSRFFFETTQKLTADDLDTSRTDVYERAGGVTTLVTKPTGVPDPDSAEANFGAISADGSRAFFQTDQKLTADDTDAGRTDVYERAGGVTTLVSKPVGVADPDTAGVYLFGASAAGNRVIFETIQRMTPNDNDSGRNDVYAAGSPDPPPPAPQQPGPPTTGSGSPPPGLLPGPCANQGHATRGRDVLDGTAAGDTLRGLAGDDRLNGFAGRRLPVRRGRQRPPPGRYGQGQALRRPRRRQAFRRQGRGQTLRRPRQGQALRRPRRGQAFRRQGRQQHLRGPGQRRRQLGQRQARAHPLRPRPRQRARRPERHPQGLRALPPSLNRPSHDVSALASFPAGHRLKGHDPDRNSVRTRPPNAGRLQAA